MMLAGMSVIGLIDNFVIVIARDGGLWQFHAMRAGMAVPARRCYSWLFRPWGWGGCARAALAR